MGTTLTGTTPQDTYDSLIKVTDNGPLSGSLKALSDGLGNDSTLSLSTTAASIAGTLAVTGNATFDTTTLFVDAANDLVGIGTITPASKANILATKTTALTTAADFLTLGLTIDDSTAFNNVGVGGGIAFRGKRNSAGVQTIYAAIDSSKEDAAGDAYVGALRFYTNQNSTGVPLERMRITSTGNVGIGTSAPAATLHLDASGGATIRLQRTSASANRFDVGTDGTNMEFNVRDTGNFTFSGTGSYVRLASATGGIQFNGDTAAANALDDYEEGTFTPTIIGTTTAGTATYGGGQQGLYTKIGRMVYFSIYLGYSGGTGAGDLRIAGLPFTIASADIPSFSIGTFLNVALTASNVPLTSGVGNSTQVRFDEIPTGGGTQAAVPYDAAAVIAVSGFYQV